MQFTPQLNWCILLRISCYWKHGTASPMPCWRRKTTQSLGGDDRYVLLASDGVWDALSLEDAHALVLQHEAEPLAEVAQRLVQAAVQKGSRDNVSAMLLDVRSFR